MDIDSSDPSGGGPGPGPGGGGAGGNGNGSDDIIAGQLLHQFSCMNTTDKDVLIIELKKLVGDAINNETAQFWLDMNNWNLQAAVGSYFDYEQPNIPLPSMKLVSDVTIGEGEEVPPNSPFTKTWRIMNSGDDTWPPGCCLRFVDGDQMCHVERVSVHWLAPGETADVSVDMISPQRPGIYQGQWRMQVATGQFFGDVIWVILTVSEGGLLSVTQQMSKFEVNEIHRDQSSTSWNPHLNSNQINTNSPQSIQQSIINNPFATTATTLNSSQFHHSHSLNNSNSTQIQRHQQSEDVMDQMDQLDGHKPDAQNQFDDGWNVR